DHAADQRRAAQAPAARHRDDPVARVLLGLGLEAPVDLAPAHQLGEAGRDRNPEVPGFAARFEQQHLVAPGLGQAVGEDAAGGAAADDHVVEAVHECSFVQPRPGTIGAPMKAAISSIWQASIGLPYWIRQPRAFAAFSSAVSSGCMMISATVWPGCSLAASKGSGSSSRRPSEVALTIRSWPEGSAEPTAVSRPGRACATRSSSSRAFEAVRFQTVSRDTPATASAQAIALAAPPAPAR